MAKFDRAGLINGVRRYAAPTLSAMWFIAALADIKYRQAQFDAQTALNTERPIFFTPVPTAAFVFIGAVVVVAFLLAGRRRWISSTACAVLAAILLLLFWMDSDWPADL